MIQALFRSSWRGFLRFFGLDACPVVPDLSRRQTPEERATRERLERLLRRP